MVPDLSYSPAVADKRTRSASLAFLGRYLLALLLFNLTACSSFQTVSVDKSMRQGTPPGVEIGSLVKVTMLDRSTDTFRVMEMNEEGLGGNAGFYRFEDMRTLKVDRPNQNKGEAAAWIWGVILLGGLIALIANADAVRVCSPPCEDSGR